jgi:hypothetical protein
MTKLIGTNPNQVPSNADLGSAAFMDAKDFLLSRGSDLSKINAIIPKTSSNVFIYDTSNDFDGGAWRKRTQHTSWYNETLNTTTRGSRKEFPAVAVIVCDNDYLTIYDGDDSTLPMWMVFNSGSTATDESVLRFGDIGTAVALNATLVVRVKNHYGPTALNFISEKALTYRDNGVHEFVERQGIVDRNILHSEPHNYGSPYIRSSTVIDIDITSLDNAPIDNSTGLPVPTIALATTLGVSVIKDDGSQGGLPYGTIVDITSANGWPISGYLTFDHNNYIIAHVGNATGQGLLFRYPIPSTDITVNAGDRSVMLAGANIYNQNYPHLGKDLGAMSMVTKDESGFATDGKNINLHLAKYYRYGNSDYGENAVAYINSKYNTGWMFGDTKLATLSDTSMRGHEYNHSGITFRDSGRIASHTYTTGSTSWNVVDDTSNTSEGYFGLTIPTEDGKQYTIYHTRSVLNTSGNQNHLVFVSGDNSTIYWGDGQNNLTDILTFVAQGSNVRYVVYSRNNATTTHTIDVSVSEQDRSTYKNGLQAIGNITKAPVATGADLMSYSGFSTSNYLEQEYNSNFDFGTGDFSLMCWVNTSSSANGYHETYISRAGRAFDLSKTTLENYRFYITPSTYISTPSIKYNGWVQLVAVRKSGIGYIYVNGHEEATGALATAVNSGYSDDDQLMIGLRRASGLVNPSDNSKIALVRISTATPNAEQVAKMYNDEKHLFQENAKATFYGSNDQVSALGYDNDTEVLHVGTDQGRSDFQGLRRINNTTKAVATSISAADGFIVED